METTKNKLTPFEEDFFKKLRNYIEKPIYFYGSIQRDDYFPQKSDIDIDIFSTNISSTLHLLANFLHISKDSFKKSLYKMDKTNVVIPGYKGKYIDEENNLIVEISIYEEKYKEEILREHKSKFIVPLYITILLIVLKIFHYHLGIIPIFFYSRFKKYLANFCDNNKAEFVIIDV
jgi:predicted nucleotidyltransferase